jgi:hypothetical protein
MELQLASTAMIEAVRTGAGVETPTVAVKDVRVEAARTAATALALIDRRPAEAAPEEVMVPDQRANLTPAQSVEQKLTALLRSGAAIPVSHFRLAKLCRKG